MSFYNHVKIVNVQKSNFAWTGYAVSQALKIGDNNVIESKGGMFTCLTFIVDRCEF